MTMAFMLHIAENRYIKEKNKTKNITVQIALNT